MKLKLEQLKNNTGQIEGVKANPRQINKDDYEKLIKSLTEDPDFLNHKPLHVYPHKGKYIVLGGNQRLKALRELGYTDVPVTIYKEDTPADVLNARIIKDNSAYGSYDMDMLANEWSDMPLDDWGINLPDDWLNHDDEDGEPEQELASLAERFVVPPFSILDTKQGYWQSRKRAWIATGIKSELGRGGEDGKGSIGGNGASLGAGLQAKRGKDGKLEYKPILKRHEGALTFSGANDKDDFVGKAMQSAGGGTSIFDPVLCEISYRWFNIAGGSVLDPFAGGSVRGIVASKLGHKYTGHELRAEQVEANKIQGKELIKDTPTPEWITGDSNKTLDNNNETYDMILSCPPYADLEVYSDDKDDLSNMPYKQFLEFYSSIIKKSVAKLKDDRFIVWVVGEVRSKDGEYYNLVNDTTKLFEDAGAKYYNEIILLNSIGSLPMRSARAFNASRKIGKCHQNVLVFYKGNLKNIKANYGEVVSPAEIEEMITEQTTE